MVTANVALMFMRISIAAIFLAHGRGKMGSWKAPAQPGGMSGVMKLLSICEPLGAIAILFGVLTWWAALGLAIIMVGAMYLKVFKWKAPFFALDKNGWELDLIILAGLVVLMAYGPGAWALMA